jgi:2-keto-4-pentenoate hydratase/2-oxohepta-3-ene-1,7-dioic acid hydratase in catechol pathway
VVTPDETNRPGNLAMRAKINGELVQMGSTAEMFFDIPKLMAYLSELTTLHPGDVILTGSPKLMCGEPQPAVSLKPGDNVEVSIEGLGSVVNTVISEGQAQS